MPKYKGLIISDVHVGSTDLNRLHKEYLELFIHKINNMKKLDFVVITGDFFDHKFYLNSKEASMAYIMLKDLVLACKEKNSAIRIVYGTESHECNQYDILSLMKIYDNIKVIKYVEDEELLPDMNVLYIPEEHIIDKKEYYDNYFTNINKYDYVFGHGIIREVMKEAVVHIENKETENTKRKKVPIFNTVELEKICKGQVYFGHYHINQEIDDKIFSVGSFTRWQFGEEGRKGFYEVSCNTEKEKYENKFIENSLAPIYKTISFGFNNEVFKGEDELKSSLSSIDATLDRDVYDNVRFMFNIPTNVENPESTINYLKERYKFKDNIKLEIVHGYIDEKRKTKKEQVKSDNEKYDFIFDKDIPIEEKTSMFISIEYNKDISPENIANYLYKPLNEIL